MFYSQMKKIELIFKSAFNRVSTSTQHVFVDT